MGLGRVSAGQHVDPLSRLRYGTEMARRASELSLAMRQAGCRTPPGLLVWCGAPRRNRTADPILTMDLAVTAVHTSVSAGRW